VCLRNTCGRGRDILLKNIVLCIEVSEDRIEMYVDPDVQSLLKQLTAKDYHRVFRKRKVGQRLKEPKYSFMTEEQLQETLQEADRRADRLLQMPPVLRPRQPIDKVLSFDPHIQGLEKSTVIFTDITMNVSDRVGWIGICTYFIRFGKQ
jgi:hypothetical protein